MNSIKKISTDCIFIYLSYGMTDCIINGETKVTQSNRIKLGSPCGLSENYPKHF